MKESDVQSVFDQERLDRQAQMEKLFEEKLTQAVKDGKITESQKQAIIAKRKELQNQRLELENWAQQNGIEPQYLYRGFGMKGIVMKGHWRFK